MSTAATAQEKAPVGSFNPPTPSARLARRIWISFVAGLVAIAVLTAASGLAAFRYSSATGWVTNAHLALDHLYDLRVATARMAQRTELFVTTGDESYLAPREVEQRQALEALRSLSQSAGDSAASRRLLDDLASAAQARIDLDNGIVASRRLRGEDAAINGLRAERGRKIDQIFDDRIAQVETNERRLLDSHLAAERWLGRITIIVIILGCALALAAVGSAGSFISRALAMLHGSIAEEASARETLLRLNETLEERVAERSAAAEQRALELAHSQSALYRQTRLLQSLLVSMADAVIVCDKQMKLVEVNPAAERLLGREIRTLPIDQWPARFAFLAEEGGKPLGRADWPLARAARGEQIHARWLLSEAGKTSWLEGSAAPVRDDNGSILGTAMVFRDITDRQNAAEELSLARDLALESARLRSEFLTKMSHESSIPSSTMISVITCKPSGRAATCYSASSTTCWTSRNWRPAKWSLSKRPSTFTKPSKSPSKHLPSAPRARTLI